MAQTWGAADEAGGAGFGRIGEDQRSLSRYGRRGGGASLAQAVEGGRGRAARRAVAAKRGAGFGPAGRGKAGKGAAASGSAHSGGAWQQGPTWPGVGRARPGAAGQA